MVKHIAKIVLGEELYNIKDTEVRGDLNNHASNTDIHVTAAEKEYWNSKVNPPSYSAPTAKQLTYTGEAQDLLNPGSSTSGSIQYSTDETNWSTTIPQGTNAGTYTVYWKFAGSEIVYVDSTAINVTITKANPTYTAPTAKTLTYNGNALDLINAGTTNDGTISYSSDNENWGSSIPQGTNAGNYTGYWKLTGDANHNDVTSTAINVSIAKVTPTVTAPTAKTGLVYNGTAQELVNAGSTDFGTLQYSLDDETYSASVPSVIAGGDHTVYYKVVEDSNVNGTNAQSVSVSVAKLNRNVSFFGDANGHEHIDLGLPSGTLWATMNIGANAPEAYGNFYMYGKGSSTYNSSDSTYTGTEDPLSFSVDTARQTWGGDWHMPTKAQLEELTANTTYEWTTVNGVRGGKFTASNGNYIFIPAAGRWSDGSYNYEGTECLVWSSSSPDGSYAFGLDCIDGRNDVYYTNRKRGFSVRGVIDSSIKPKLNVGQTNTIEVFTSGSPTIIVTSSNTSVATVSGMTVTAIGGGSTTITVTVAADDAYNEYTYSYTLSIYDPYRFGQEWFDLGLPSGRLWSRGNIISKEGGGYKIGSEIDLGGYFSWGNIVPHFSSDGSTFDDGYSFNSTNYDATSGKSLTGNIASNDAAHDAALACLGGSIRMPTKDEFQELLDNTDSEFTIIGGVDGLKCMKKSDHSMYVFFPFTGLGEAINVSNEGFAYYWSSSYSNSNHAYIMLLTRNLGGIKSIDTQQRYYGMQVRAVK